MEEESDTEKYICYDCVGENYLKSIIKKNGLVAKCSYCENDEIEAIWFSDFVDRIRIAFEQHYDQSWENDLYPWSSYNDSWEPEGDLVINVIMDSAGIEENIATDVQEELADTHYDHDSAEMGEIREFDARSYYHIKKADDLDWQIQWADFEHILKTSARFFNKKNEELLKSVFDNIESLNTVRKRPVVRNIGPESEITHLYRGRVFQSDFKLKIALESPDKELGPPPSECASAGRMNSRGVSVFYGATESQTALAEIRPPVGSKVAVASFELTRKLKVLDLSALKLTRATGSIFDKNYANQLSRIMFLRNLSQRMTRPIMPDDEHSEYLTTQVIADFLASELKFDGIIFSSAQSKVGSNVTLFHSASKVTSIQYAEGTEIEANLTEWYGGEEPTPKYTVYEHKSREEEDAEEEEDSDLAWSGLPGKDWDPIDPDPREVALSIDLDSIKVEHIESVTIKSKQYDVERLDYLIFSDELEDL